MYFYKFFGILSLTNIFDKKIEKLILTVKIGDTSFRHLSKMRTIGRTIEKKQIEYNCVEWTNRLSSHPPIELK